MRRLVTASIVASALSLGVAPLATAEEPDVQLKDLQVQPRTELEQNMQNAQRGYEIHQKEQQQQQMEREHPDPHGGLRLQTSPNGSVGGSVDGDGGSVNYRHTTP